MLKTSARFGKLDQYSRPIENILARLDGETPCGDGRWSARCPAHDDRTPSLLICECDDGHVLLHCHAGCSTKHDILPAIGLGLRDLFADDKPPAHRRNGNDSTTPATTQARRDDGLDVVSNPHIRRLMRCHRTRFETKWFDGQPSIMITVDADLDHPEDGRTTVPVDPQFVFYMQKDELAGIGYGVRDIAQPWITTSRVEGDSCLQHSFGEWQKSILEAADLWDPDCQVIYGHEWVCPPCKRRMAEEDAERKRILHRTQTEYRNATLSVHIGLVEGNVISRRLIITDDRGETYPQVLPQLLPRSPKQGVLPYKLPKSQPRLFFPMFAGFSSMDAAA